jgi:hypothetical protein
MKRITFLLICLITTFATMSAVAQWTRQGQPEGVAPKNEDLYVLDGTNHSFAWGRHITPLKIAIGLGDEGVFEIRNNNAIWLVELPDTKDRQIADIVKDKTTGNMIFAHHFSSNGSDEEAPVRIIGSYNVLKQTIFDERGEPLATIAKGEIVSLQGKVCLHINTEASKELSAFFFLYHYRPLTMKR